MTITDLAIRPVFMAAAILLGIGGGVASADEIKSSGAVCARSKGLGANLPGLP